MSRSFVLFVVVGVLLTISITAAQQCPENQEWTTCGSACPPSCSPSNQTCTLQCIEGCQCKKDFLLNANGQCVSHTEC
ncbi:chymotrypsin inhibitor-like [Anoplolepis gracilipes]|uniref:chymotrypsin inhibitor-like n=1 Tax=Anoplolepis gracilipes TaxID=354296 RepID=UPI003BA00C54